MTQHVTTTPLPQLRLPGQAAAPEGPVDMTMMYLMHHAFRRDLAYFAATVPQTAVGASEAWSAMAERWALFAFVLHEHHQGEDDVIWPALAQRVTPEERETLDAMESEHGEIDPLLEACRDGLEQMRSHPSEDVRNALAVRLVAAKEHLARHLAHEETDTIALIQRTWTAQDWEAVDDELKKRLSLPDLVRIVPWALLDVPDEVRRDLFALPGGRAHQLMWLATRGRFARRHRAAFGSAA